MPEAVRAMPLPSLPGLRPLPGPARCDRVAEANSERLELMSGPSRKQQLEEMLAADPGDPFLCYGLAMEYVSQGDDAEAVRRFRALLDASPDYVPAYLQVGQALVRLGRSGEARAVWVRGVAAAQRAGDRHAA